MQNIAFVLLDFTIRGLKVACITLLCDHDITKKPRSSRILALLDTINATHNGFTLSVIAKDCLDSSFKQLKSSATLYSFKGDKSSKERTKLEQKRIIESCQKGDFDTLIFTKARAKIATILQSLPTQDVLIVEDITLLPFACAYKERHKHTKVLIDLREFYPLEYENDKFWLESGLGLLFKHLCAVYLPKVDMALSVSNGLCERYRREFGIKCELFLSLPPYFDFTPKPTDRQDIRILYHGFISHDRHSFELLDVARCLADSNFSLYVMALSNQKGFLSAFKRAARDIKKLHIIAPVSLKNIIPKSHYFDIGLIPFKPSTFNLQCAMPNKLFEYIQARLAIVATPLCDISAFLRENKCGIITKGFEAEQIAKSILELESSTIDMLKHQSHAIAKDYHISKNLDILKRVLGKLGAI